MSSATPVSLVYFGKIPSRGDFVRGGKQGALLQTLDRWVSQAVDLMTADPRWKEVYDRSPPAHFAFMGMRSRVGLAGHLVASTDASGRRFPFIAGGSFEISLPEGFVARSPMVLARCWPLFERTAQEACAGTESLAGLSEFVAAPVELDTAPAAYEASLRDFLGLQTVSTLEGLLRRAGHPIELRQTLLALGLLLQPVPASGSSRLDKGLRLPLPLDPLYQPYVASLWLALVSGFLRAGDFELALFTSRSEAEPPALLVGFSGGSPAVLQAVLDPEAGRHVFVDLCEAEWVEAYVREDYGVKKLSSYLQQPRLSLHQAQASFREAFLGT